MSVSDTVRSLMRRPEFPRSAKYSPQWVIDGRMGLHPLWLTEWLCDRMTLRPGMRVLDLGCGKALSSVFLAKEFDLKVWALDLWISASDNLRTIEEHGLEDSVFPLQGDARDLPFADSYFDAILGVNSFIYFGTDDLYLKYIRRLLKPSGQLGIVLNCLTQDMGDQLPSHLVPFWGQDCWTWHTVDWWRNHWERTGLVEIEVADLLTDGCQAWLQFNQARLAAGNDSEDLRTDIQVMEEDDGRFMGWGRLVASAREAPE
jgi:SAM-dependent methyltransferase